MKNKLISIILSFTIILTFMPVMNVSAEVYEGTCGDNLTWTLNEEGTLIISGAGEMVCSIANTPWNAYKDNIKNVKIEEGITSIGNGAFFECRSLISVSIPDGVTSIGEGAFDSCSDLTIANIPDSVTSIGERAFFDCSRLSDITIPDGITSIGEGIFSGCNITSIIIPDGVTSIGNDAFSYCDELTSIIIPNSVTNIGTDAFSYCCKLTSIIIPDSVTSIGGSSVFTNGNAFSGCNKLSDIYYAGTEEQWQKINTSTYFEPPEPTIHYNSKIGDCGDNLFWIFSDDTLTISGTGDMYDWTEETVPWGVLSDSIRHINIADGVTSVGSNAFNGCGNLTGIIIPEGITRIENSAFANCGSLTDIIIPSGVTNIGNNAFSGCDGLTNITIPSSVTNIEEGAFNACTALENVYITDLAAWCNIDFAATPMQYASNLYLNKKLVTEITIPDSVTVIKDYAFSGCNLLTEINIPHSVVRIGKESFSGCNNLSNIVIPDSVTNIGTDAFKNCSGLSKIYYQGTDSEWSTINEKVPDIDVDYITHMGACGDLTWMINREGSLIISGTGNMPITQPWRQYSNNIKAVEILNGVESISDSAFSSLDRLSKVSVAGSVKTIGSHAFSECERLKDVTMSEGITRIDNGAFSECRKLTSITIPDGVTSIGDRAFWCCDNLTSITMPDSVTNIGNEAFAYCGGLTSITIPNRVTSIGNDVFASCSNLESIIIPTRVTSIGSNAFGGCRSLKSITIPTGITSIGSNAFGGCSGLTSIIIPDGVTSIGKGTFAYCSKLTNIAIPDNVDYIGDNSFYCCSGLTSIVIPDNVDYIGDYAFYYCSNLKSISIPGNVEIIGDNAFDSCSNLCDIYYSGTEEQWEAIDIGTANDVLSTATIHYVTDMGLCGNNLSWILFADGKLSLNSNGNVSEWDNITEVPWSKYENSITSIEFDGSRSQWKESFKDSVPSSVILHTIENMENTIAADHTKVLYYTGNAIETSFDIKDGDVMLSEGTDYIIESYENNINAGTATAILKGCNKENEKTYAKYTGTKTLTFEINKSEAYMDEKASPKDSIIYNGMPQELINPGKSSSGIIQYSLDESGEYSIEIPVGTEVGEYTVFYKVIGDKNHTDSEIYRISSKIVKANPNISVLPTAKKKLVYSGKEQELIDEGKTTDGTIQYSFDENSGFSEDIPVGTEAKEYTVFYKVVGDNGHEDSEVYQLTAKIAKAEPSIIANPSVKEGLIYNNAEQELVNAGEAQNGTMQYSLDKNGEYSADIPTAINAGIYTVFYKIAGDSNYSDSEISELTIEIAKAEPKFDLPSGLTVLFGKTLDDIQLPKGFVWTDGSTRLNEVGTMEFDAIYTPDDTNNYTTVAIKISVEVNPLPTNGTEGEIVWNVSGDNLDTLTLSGGSMNDYKAEYAPWYAHKKTIKHVIIEDSVNNVGAYAFYGMSEITDVKVASAITSIGYGAFKNCSGLQSINIPNTVSSIGEIAFSGCVAVRELNIPEGVTEIENSTFENCRALSKIDIPNSIDYIGKDVFKGCDNITVIRVPFIGAERTEINNDKIFGYLFGSDNSNIPLALTRVEITGTELSDYIPDNAFKNCGNIEDIIIDGGRSIGNYAFENCKNLKNLYLPKSVKNIGNEILKGCKKIETLVIPFVGINRLDENTETSVIGAFFGWDDNNLATGTRQYYNNNQSWHLYNIPSTLKNVSVLNQTNIPAGAFSESPIENVSIISGAVMNDYVFYNCTELKKVSLPSDMTNIGKNAFAECENLEIINIPTKVKEIGDHAFYGASGLKDVTMPESIETIASDIFDSSISMFSARGFSLMSADELVITCAMDSAAYNYASARGIQTNVVSSEQLDKRGTATSVALLSDNTYLFDITDAYNMNGVLHIDLYDESGTIINNRTQSVGEGAVEYREEFSKEEMENVSFAQIYIVNENGDRVSKTDEIISVNEGGIPTIPENDIKIVYRDGIVRFNGNSSLKAGAVLIQAIYDNGRLQSSTIYPISNIDDVIEVNSGFTKGEAKFMLWDSLNKMIPLAEAITE